MTDFGSRAGTGDMLKSVYDSNDDGVVDAVPAHKATHQLAGDDALNVSGLTGTTPRALLADATPGRVVRQFELYILDGSSGDTINVQTLEIWNGDTIAAQDNLAKGGDETNFALDAGGLALTIKVAGLTGNAIASISCVITGSTTGAVYNIICLASEGSLVVLLSDATDGTQIDLTAAVDLGVFTITISYLTDE